MTLHTTNHGDFFAVVPEQLIYSSVSGTAIKVYCALRRHGSDPANCYPSHKRLAELTQMAVPTVRRAITELVEAGWVVIEQRFNGNGQTSNGYHVQGVMGKESFTPQITGDQGGVITGDQGGCSQVINEREPSNESHMNNNTGAAQPEEAPSPSVAQPGVGSEEKLKRSQPSPRRPPGPRLDKRAAVQRSLAAFNPTEAEVGQILNLVLNDPTIKALPHWLQSDGGRQGLESRLTRLRGTTVATVIYNPAAEQDPW